MAGPASGWLGFWGRACRRLGVILAASALVLLGMSFVLPGAVASATELAATASPAPTPTPSASPGDLRQVLPHLVKPLTSASTPTPNTITASYSCDFSKYGTGITAVSMSVTFAYEPSWPVNQPMAFGFTTDSITLPSQVSSQLTSVNSMTIAATIAAQHATQATISLSGPTTATLPNPPTTIPQTDVFGQVTFPAKGTGVLELPAQSIVVTPMAGTTAKPAITCTTQTAATAQQITVGSASGPFYNCVTTVGTGGPGNTETSSGLTDMTITESGTKQVGKTVTVKLSSDDVAALIVAVAVEASLQAKAQITKATFTAALMVTGPQPGTLHPSATITDPTATSFSTSEALKLRKAGTIKVDIPAAFRLDFYANTTDVLNVACKLVTTPAPVGLTMKVAQAPSSSGSGSDTDDEGTSATGGSTTGEGGTTEATGTPVGAPATGGGNAPGADVPLAIGGLAIVLAGGFLVLRGVARRRAAGKR
jgi:hypothetical protein